MLKGFKDFLMRGNVVDLAVAVVIGAAFGKVVAGLREGLIDPLIAAIAGEQDLSQVGQFTWNNVEFSIGIPLTDLVNFVIIGATIYFLAVMPLNKLAERRARGIEPKSKAPNEEILLLTEIRDLLRDRG